MVGTAFALSLIGLGAVTALPAQTVEERQIIGGGGSGGGAIWGPSNPSGPCQPGNPASGSSWAPCFLPPSSGGFEPPSSGDFDPPNEKREGGHVEARQFSLPPDAHSNPKKAIAELEQRLEDLKNKRHKTWQDRQEIEDIEDELQDLVGITNISAPGGGSSTFTPGKRDSVSLDPVGAFSSGCPDTQGVKDVLKMILNMEKLSREDIRIAQQLQHLLTACGDAISDGTATLTPLDKKRDNSAAPGFEAAYAEMVQSLGDGGASLDSWLMLQSFADIAESHGATIDRSLALGSASLVPRQITIGNGGSSGSGGSGGSGICDPRYLESCAQSLQSIVFAFPNNPPSDIWLMGHALALILKACGLTVTGWPSTTLVPGSTIPGGGMIPDPYQSGGAMVPNPSSPGGALVPNPTISGGSVIPATSASGGALVPNPTATGGSFIHPRNDVSDDVATLLSALHDLEDRYGTYGSGTIPSSVFWDMAWIVVTLQKQGVIVMGWPTTTFGPSD